MVPEQFVGAANILNQRWVLTAASAVRNPPRFTRFEIVCGRTYLSAILDEPNQQRVRVSAIINHPEYLGSRQPYSANDIALV